MLQKALRHLLRRAALAGRAGDLVGQRGEFRAHDIGIERLVAVGPKIAGKCARLDLADADIGVGHRQRTAAAVAGRSRIGAGGIRARRGSARRRNAGSSRRPPPPC